SIHRLPSMDPSTSSSVSLEETKTTILDDSDVVSATNTSTETTPPSDPVDNVELGGEIIEEEDDEDEEIKRLDQVMSRPTRRRVDVISSTMNPMVEQLIADAAVIAVNKFDVEKEYCRYIKQYLDMQIGPYFHCICGRKFGAYVSASSSWSFCFRIEQYTFLVFRSNDFPLTSSRAESESSESRSSSSRKSFS
ncbi:hypothetical protein PENTCL1PPCAC_17328, partial [Pristionchus entomophagus]